MGLHEGDHANLHLLPLVSMSSPIWKLYCKLNKNSLFNDYGNNSSVWETGTRHGHISQRYAVFSFAGASTL